MEKLLTGAQVYDPRTARRAKIRAAANLRKRGQKPKNTRLASADDDEESSQKWHCQLPFGAFCPPINTSIFCHRATLFTSAATRTTTG
jgi:hypothetical protein